jgi:hypothetical protein
MARVIDLATVRSPRLVSCEPVKDVLDVSASSTDGQSFVVKLGSAPVADLLVKGTADFTITRDRSTTGKGAVYVTVTLARGSARWKSPIGSAAGVPVAPGRRVTIRIRAAGHATRAGAATVPMPPFRTFGVKIVNRLTEDVVSICNATTREAVKDASSGHFDFSAVTDASGDLPTPQVADEIRDTIAELNQAINVGDFDLAFLLTEKLELPFPEGSNAWPEPRRFSNAQKRLAAVIAGADGTGSYDRRNRKLLPVLGLHGTGRFVRLINDMADQGLSDFQAPPTLDQIQEYYGKVRAAGVETHQTPETITEALLEACQKVMAGMQVHYGQAGNQPFGWNSSKKSWVAFNRGQLVEDHGQAVLFDNMGDAHRCGRTPNVCLPAAASRRFRVAINTHAASIEPRGPEEYIPQGYETLVSRQLWGRRFETNCQGMAAFRLRTLPPGFLPIGCVDGDLRSSRGDGHSVAVFASDRGRYYLSSNGKHPIAVTGRGSIGSAVEHEFVTLYSESAHRASDFLFGFGLAPSSDRTGPAGSAASAPGGGATSREAIVDGTLLLASIDLGIYFMILNQPNLHRLPFAWANFAASWWP